MSAIKRWIFCGFAAYCLANIGPMSGKYVAGQDPAAAEKAKADKEAAKKANDARKAADAKIRAAEQLVKRGGVPSATDKAAIDQHILGLMRALYLNADNFNAGQAKERISQYLALNPRLGPEMRSIIVESIFREAMKVVIAPQATPASKINALWLIAELDQSAATSNTPPKPFGKSSAELLRIAQSKTAPIYLRCIAMAGLDRHTRLQHVDWTPATKKAVTDLCSSIVQSQPTSNLDAAGHTWLVRRAMGTLGVLKSEAAKDFAIAKLLDPTVLPSLRLECVRYLNTFDLSKETPENKSQIFIGGAQLLYQECGGWLDVRKVVASLRGSMDGGMGMGMGMDSGGGMGMPGMDAGMGMGMSGGGAMDGAMGMPGMEGGMGMPGMDGATPGMPKLKATDRQNVETQIARKKLNAFSQAVHILLDGAPYKDYKKPSTAAVQGGVLNGVTEDGFEVPKIKVIGALEAFQTAVNRSSLSDPMGTGAALVSVLETVLPTPTLELKNEIEKIPGFAKFIPPRKMKMDPVTGVIVPNTESPEAGKGAPSPAPGPAVPPAAVPGIAVPAAAKQPNAVQPNAVQPNAAVRPPAQPNAAVGLPNAIPPNAAQPNAATAVAPANVSAPVSGVPAAPAKAP